MLNCIDYKLMVLAFFEDLMKNRRILEYFVGLYKKPQPRLWFFVFNATSVLKLDLLHPLAVAEHVAYSLQTQHRS